MRIKILLPVALVAIGVAGVAWFYTSQQPSQTTDASAAGRKALYYTCAMHPWVRETKPGPCPVCGMNLTPVYGNENRLSPETNATRGGVTLKLESINVINVQTELVERRPVRRTLHLAGQIVGNTSNTAWFEFTAYERDLPWLKTGQTFDVSVPSAPDKVYHAQIRTRGTKPFADADFDMMTGSVKVRAEISNPPVQPGDLGRNKLFNNLHAEAHAPAETETVLAVSRSAVISRGIGPMVYLDAGNGRYVPRTVALGRVGDEFVEVLAGLKEGEKVVTTGNVLIDSEAQLTAGQ